MKLILIIAVLCFPFKIFSQSNSPSVISSAGEYNENAEGSLSWTLGETVVGTVDNGTNMLSQGFQQNSYTITEVPEVSMAGFELKIYPNPAADYVNIEGENIEIGKIELFDISGKLIASYEVNGNSYKLDLKEMSSAIYVLKVYNTEKIVFREYKISKNQ